MNTSKRLLNGLLIVSLAAPTPPASANPVGESVQAGQATFDRSRPGQLVINQGSHRAIINWADFSIARGEVTRFVMPSSSASVLNRVVGVNPSRLFGTLRGNGHVIVINPNGILVGKGGVVNTRSLTVSTLDVADTAYLSGAGLRFSGPSTASVRNEGSIRVLGGDVYLIGHQVANAGVIEARRGRVGLAAGSEVILQPAGEERLSVIAGNTRPRKDGPGVNNSGTIEAVAAELKAAGGNIYSLAINNGGVIRATGFRREGGRVMLVADGGNIDNSGTISARNADGSGGSVLVSAGHNAETPATVTHSGSIDVRGETAGTRGGDAALLGDHVGVFGRGSVDASGAAGGGTALIGGDTRGENPAVQNARATFIGSEAQVRADALDQGDGGRVIVYASDAARIYGALSARGGAEAGRGGFIETSGGHLLDLLLTPDVTAAYGRGGHWLIDPNGIDLVAGAGNIGINDSNPFMQAAAPDATLGVDLIVAALNGGASVTIVTSGTGGGDINVAAPLDFNGTGNNSLTLNAHNNIHVNASILDSDPLSADSLNLTLTANAGSVFIDAAVQTSGGDLSLNALDLSIGAGGRLNSGSGLTTLTALGGRSIGVGTVGEAFNVEGDELGRITTSGGLSLVTSTGGDIIFKDISAAQSQNVTGTITANSDENVRFAQDGAATFSSALVLNADRDNSGGAKITLGDNARVDSRGHDVTLVAPDVDLGTGSLLDSRSGVVTVQAVAGRDIVVGGAAAADNIGLTATELDSFRSSGGLKLVTSGAGKVTVAGAVSYAGGPLSLASDRDLAIDESLTTTMGSLTLNADRNNDGFGVLTVADTKVAASSGQALNVIAADVNLGGSGELNSGAGLITITATGGRSLSAGASVADDLELDAGELSRLVTSGGLKLASGAGGAVTVDSALSFASVELESDAGIAVNQNVSSTSGLLSLDADRDNDGVGALVLTDAGLNSGGQALNIHAADLDVNGLSTIISGGGLIMAGASGNRRIVLGDGGTVADFRLSGAELGRISTAAQGGLTLVAGSGAGIVVDNILAADSVAISGLLSLEADGAISFDNNASTFNSLSALAGGGISVNRHLTTAGPLTFNADTGNTGADLLTVAAGQAIQSGNGAISITAADLDLQAGSSLAAGSGLVTVTASADRSIGLGQAPGQFSISGSELAAVSTSGGLKLVTSGAGDITVDGITAGQSANVNATWTLEAGNAVRFTGAASEFRSLIADAGSMIELGANVTTTRSQNYNDAVSLSSDVTLVGTDLTLAQVTGNDRDLTLTGSGLTTLGGEVSGVKNFTSGGGGGTVLSGGRLATSGDQIFADSLDLTANTRLEGVGITLDVVTANNHDLTLNASGVTRIDGAKVTGVNHFTSGGAGVTQLGGTFTTAGNQTYHGAIELDADTTLEAIDLLLGSVDGGGFNLTLSGSGATTLGAVISGVRDFKTDGGGTTLFNGGSVSTSGTQQYDDDVLLGTDTMLTGMDVKFSGAIDSMAATLHSLSVDAFGMTTFAGPIGGTDRLSALTTDSPGITALGGNVFLNGASATFNDRVLLAADTVIDEAGAGHVTFNSSVDSAAGNNFALTVNTTGGGQTIFNGAVGGDSLGLFSDDFGLGSLTTDQSGSTVLNGAVVTTVGAQTYNDAVTLVADTTMNGTDITFAGALDSAMGTRHSLVVNASGVTRFGGGVGATERLAGVTTDQPGRTELANGAFNVEGSTATTFGDQVLLGANVTLSQDGAGDVVFNNSLDSAVDNNFDLTISAAGGGVTVFGDVVGNDALAALSDDLGLGSLTVDSPGGIRFLGGTVRTTESQTYNHGVALGSDATFEGRNVFFNGTVDSVAGAFRSLTVNAVADLDPMIGGGVARFGGVVGGTDRLASLTSGAGTRTEIGGDVNLNGAGATTFSFPVLLTSDVTFNQAGLGDLNFSSLDSAQGNNFSLTVNTPGGANTFFNGAIGQDQFGLLSSDTGLGALTTDAAGLTTFRGFEIRTSGSQTFNDAVRLGADMMFFGANVRFNGALDSVPGSTRRLTVNSSGVTAFNGAVGETERLGRVTTDAAGSTEIGGGMFRVTGMDALTFNDAVRLSQNLILDHAGSGDVIFSGTVDSVGANRTLAINTVGGGRTVFTGSVGAGNALGSLTTDGVGVTEIGGATVRTIGNQIHADEVILSGNVTLDAGSATLGKITGASRNLTVNADTLALTASQPITVARLTLQPRTPNRPISLGVENAARLSLTQAELDLITAPVLQIGGGNSGSIFLAAPVTLAAARVPTLSLFTGGSVEGAAQPAQPVSVNNLAVQAAGDVILTANNAINTFAARLTSDGRDLALCNGRDLAIGIVDAVVGISAGTTGAGAGGDVTLTTDNLAISQPIVVGAGRITLEPKTAGRGISLGSETPGVLGLSGAELARLRAGTLKIGNSSAGTITIDAGLNFGLSDPDVAVLSLESRGPINEVGSGSIQVRDLALRTTSPEGAVLASPHNDFWRVGAAVNGPLLINDVNGFAGAGAPPNAIDGLTGVTALNVDLKGAALNGLAAVGYSEVPLVQLPELAFGFSADVPRPLALHEPGLVWTSSHHVPQAPEPVARRIRKVEDVQSWTVSPGPQ